MNKQNFKERANHERWCRTETNDRILKAKKKLQKRSILIVILLNELILLDE